jgi:hypothetical protein
MNKRYYLILSTVGHTETGADAQNAWGENNLCLNQVIGLNKLTRCNLAIPRAFSRGSVKIFFFYIFGHLIFLNILLFLVDNLQTIIVKIEVVHAG